MNDEKKTTQLKDVFSAVSRSISPSDFVDAMNRTKVTEKTGKNGGKYWITETTINGYPLVMQVGDPNAKAMPKRTAKKRRAK